MNLFWLTRAVLLRTRSGGTLKPLAMLIASLSLVGCAAVAIEDDGAASAEVLRRTGLRTVPESTALTQRPDPAAAHGQAELLLQQPLSADTAIRLALLQNPQLRAQLAELGVARADLEQAGLISNPTFAVGALRPEGGGRWQLDFGLSQSLLDVLTRSLRRSLAQAEFKRVQLDITARLTEVLLTAQQHYYTAVAARHRAAIADLVATAAQTQADLAAAYQQAGNLTELDAVTLSTEALTRRLEADNAALAARQAQADLAADLGIAEAERVPLPQQLPLPADEAMSQPVLVEQALRDRLDLQALRQTRQQFDHALDLQNKTHGVTTLKAGVNAERDYDGTTNVGPEFSVSLPIFDRGKARAAALQARIEQNSAAIATLELSIRNDVVQALAEMDLQRQRAQRYRDTLIPQRERMVALSLQRANYMLTGPFETLLAKQQEYAAYLDYVDALGGYWRARGTLAKALGRALPSVDKGTSALPGPDGDKEMQSMDHSTHSMPMPANSEAESSPAHHHQHGGR